MNVTWYDVPLPGLVTVQYTTGQMAVFRHLTVSEMHDRYRGLWPALWDTFHVRYGSALIIMALVETNCCGIKGAHRGYEQEAHAYPIAQIRELSRAVSYGFYLDDQPPLYITTEQQEAHLKHLDQGRYFGILESGVVFGYQRHQLPNKGLITFRLGLEEVELEVRSLLTGGKFFTCFEEKAGKRFAELVNDVHTKQNIDWAKHFNRIVSLTGASSLTSSKPFPHISATCWADPQVEDTCNGMTFTPVQKGMEELSRMLESGHWQLPTNENELDEILVAAASRSGCDWAALETQLLILGIQQLRSLPIAPVVVPNRKYDFSDEEA